MSVFARVPFPLWLVALALAVASLIPFTSQLSAKPAPLVAGRATVIDGDTLEIEGRRIRLEGIDAPEAAQTCGGGWFGTWKCGVAATAQLRWLVGGRRVECESVGTDKYGRMLGLCTADNRDVNAEMVRTGHAWAFVKYSKRYEAIESEARKQRVGIWKGEAEAPWAYRERHWQVAEVEAPKGCAIKGNITENGRIFHMPWSPWYARVKVEPEKGERWFCSEAEATEAGFRPVAGP
jgi:endonuclease YncB( thermonuclease family)